MAMHAPPLPGEILREDVLQALGVSVTEAVKQLGVMRAALSRVLRGHAAISPEMALRIEARLGGEPRWAGCAAWFRFARLLGSVPGCPLDGCRWPGWPSTSPQGRVHGAPSSGQPGTAGANVTKQNWGPSA